MHPVRRRSFSSACLTLFFLELVHKFERNNSNRSLCKLEFM